MKSNSTILLVISLFVSGTLNAQLIVNEVSANLFSDLVEVKNVSGSQLDISSFYIGAHPNYAQFSTLAIQCEEIADGEFLLEDGELITISGLDLGAADGEVAIFIDDQFDSPSSIISYVQYGSAGHEREDEAVEGGVWAAGQFCVTPNFNGGQTLAYDGTGTTSSDWFTSALPSPCFENITTIDELAVSETLKVYPNPAADLIMVNSPNSGILKITDIRGAVVIELIKKPGALNVPVDFLQPGLYVATLGTRSILFNKQ